MKADIPSVCESTSNDQAVHYKFLKINDDKPRETLKTEFKFLAGRTFKIVALDQLARRAIWVIIFSKSLARSAYFPH